MNDKQLEIVNNSYDYIANVTEKQGRLLDLDTLYSGYCLSFKIENQLTKKGFKMLYDEIVNILQ